jgi:plastocyanin
MRSKICRAVALISIGGCGGGGGSNNTTGPTLQNTPTPPNGITVTNTAFAPATKTVAVGTTVEWAWDTCDSDPAYGGMTCGTHTVTFDDGTTSQVLSTGTFDRTFSVAGTYNYHCTVHPTMTGTITVQ